MGAAVVLTILESNERSIGRRTCERKREQHNTTENCEERTVVPVTTNFRVSHTQEVRTATPTARPGKSANRHKAAQSPNIPVYSRRKTKVHGTNTVKSRRDQESEIGDACCAVPVRAVLAGQARIAGQPHSPSAPATDALRAASKFFAIRSHSSLVVGAQLSVPGRVSQVS